MNPDPDFVLRGKTSSYWSRPGYLNNSELTTTTKGFDYSPDCYDYSDSKRMTQSLRSMSHQLNRVSSNLTQTLLGKNSDMSVASRSKDLHSSLRTSATERELERLMQRNLELEDSYDGRPRSEESAQWYTHPIHLSQTYTPKSAAHIRPTRSVSPVSRTAGNLGPALADELSSQSRVFREMDLKRHANEDVMAARYFPVTLGAAYYMQAADSQTGVPVLTTTLSPSRSRSRTGFMKKPKRAKSAARVDEILQDVQYSQSKNRLNYLVSEAPTIASSLNVIAITPYEAELAKLRMERLRIEEDKLLELKRQEELERIRGPKPKWYEMKSPEFHYEAHKNNQLIRSRDKWDDLLTYREDLTMASKDFRRSWETPLMA